MSVDVAARTRAHSPNYGADLFRIEVSDGVPIFNNVLQGFKSLPARFH